MNTITLPWPPAALSGHAKGRGYHAKAALTKRLRHEAHIATLAAKPGAMPPTGDIAIRIAFFPPDRRGDRVNYPNRLKPLLDGIADALKLNDSRFLPSYVFGPVVPGGRVEVELAGVA